MFFKNLKVNNDFVLTPHKRIKNINSYYMDNRRCPVIVSKFIKS